MKDNTEIDYNSKILNFMAMTETGDPDVATKYLESSNWDETIAVNNFFKKINVTSNKNSNNKNNIINGNIIDDNSNNNIINKDKIDYNFKNDINQNLIDKNFDNNENNQMKENILIKENNNQNNNQSCFNKYILDPIISFFSSCCKESEYEVEEDSSFQLLPNKIADLTQFCEQISQKIGIIILYKLENIQFLKRFIYQLSQNSMAINLLKQNCIIITILEDTNDGIRIQNLINNNQLIYPIFLFCSSKNQNTTDIFLERKNIINKLESEFTTLDSFYSTIIDTSEKINNIKNNNYKNYNDFNSLTDAEVLNKQKSEMEALEKEVQRKEEELKRQKLIEEQKKIEEELIKKKEEKELEEAKKKVVEEPSEDNPNATTISFRYPDGEKRKDRRFLKSHTIKNLYEYVYSLGKEIYTEEENNSFSLYQPFPPKKYEDMDNTLEKEGLFPNAIIQIREE